MSVRDEFTSQEVKEIFSLLRDIENTVLHRAIRLRGEERLRSVDLVLHNPKSTLDDLRVAQGERKAATYAIMIIEDLLRIFGPPRKPRREE